MIPSSRIRYWFLSGGVLLLLLLAAGVVIYSRSDSAEPALIGTYVPALTVQRFEREAFSRQHAPPGITVPPYQFPTNTPMLVLAADHTFQILHLPVTPVTPAGAPATSLTTNGTWTTTRQTESGLVTGGTPLYRSLQIHLHCGGSELFRIPLGSNPTDTNTTFRLHIHPELGLGLDLEAQTFRKAPAALLRVAEPN